MKDDAKWCEQTKPTVRARTYCMLQVTKPLNVLDEVKAPHPNQDLGGGSLQTTGGGISRNWSARQTFLK